MSETFKLLQQYLLKKMRMSHVYQPVMLKELLLHGGTCHQEDIAKAILQKDQSQADYYTAITNNMVGKVLRSHHLVEKDGKNYSLVGYEGLTSSEVDELVALCDQRLADYEKQRGEAIWAHRKKSSGYLSGTLKYEVLKRAKFRCELCGISAEEKALEVDHIIPRNHGGTDDPSNLQCLCFSCNAMKRDRDDTDFRVVRESYSHRETGCLFCEIDEERIIGENELAYAIRDGFPVTPMHTLIIPKRHVATYFDLGQAEVNACNDLLLKAKEIVQKEDKTVTGFNIGMNNGEDSGQTIFHCHIHLIPRRKGDVENPRGGG